jgi:ABC-2 type transport system ATP-binding protein
MWTPCSEPDRFGKVWAEVSCGWVGGERFQLDSGSFGCDDGRGICLEGGFLELVIERVGKRYPGRNCYALQDICLDVGPGIIGLLGPNGAGKSTLMRIIATITKPTHGTVYWNGADITRHPDEIRSVLGYLPQDFGVYPNLNAYEFLRYISAIKGVDPKAAGDRIDELLVFTGLGEAGKRRMGDYSGGMKQRVGIAQALLNDPRILIVDEPTVGLDTESRIGFRHLMAELAEDRVVILSTHIVSDVEAAANDIAIMDQGRLLLRSSPEELLGLVDGKVWDWSIPSSQLHTAKEKYVLSSIVRHKDGLHLRLVAETRPDREAKPASSPTLEEAYLYTINTHPGATPDA